MIPGLLLFLHFLVFVNWLGLAIRGGPGPCVTGLVALADGVVTTMVDQGLRRSLSRAKPMVMGIRGLLLTAAAPGTSHVG